MKFLNRIYQQKSSTYLAEFYVERAVNNTVRTLPNLLLEFEPWSALGLLIFELLLSIQSFLILRKFLFGERTGIILTLTISLVGSRSLVVLHAVVRILVVQSILVLALQLRDSTGNSTHGFVCMICLDCGAPVPFIFITVKF